MGRSREDFKILLRVNMGKRYDDQMLAAETLGDSYIVEKVEPYDSDVHQSTKCHCKMSSFKNISEGYLKTAPNCCFCRKNLLGSFI